MKPSWKIFSAFTGLFLAGVVTGGFIGARLAPPPGPRSITTERLMKRFTDHLDLTPEQNARIRPIFKQTADDLKKAREEAFKTTTEIFGRMETGIAKELTPAQRARLKEMQAEENERRKQWMAERAKKRDDPHAPPNAGGAHHGPPHSSAPGAHPRPSGDTPPPAPEPTAP